MRMGMHRIYAEWIERESSMRDMPLRQRGRCACNGARRTIEPMNKRQARQGKEPLRPLDHLRPGERPGGGRGSSEERGESPPPADAAADAASGKATRSPAEVQNREHLEGSEQGPV